MTSEASQDPKTSLIVGCGYLGRRLAVRLLEQGRTVYGTVRSSRSAKALTDLGVRPLFLSVTELITTASLHGLRSIEGLEVFYMIPPGRPGGSPSPREVLLDGLANVLATLQGGSIRRAVMVSSTGVYAPEAGATVSADTPTEIDAVSNPRAKLLLESERLWQRAGLPGTIVRLAGLYGPGRVVGLSAVREGQPLAGDPDGLLNLIHVDDAAELLMVVMGMQTPSAIELGCDDTPTPRRAYYQHLAELAGVDPPRLLTDADAVAMGIDPAALRSSASKACSNGPTCSRTGWRPRYPSFREGLAGLMETV